MAVCDGWGFVMVCMSHYVCVITCDTLHCTHSILRMHVRTPLHTPLHTPLYTRLYTPLHIQDAALHDRLPHRLTLSWRVGYGNMKSRSVEVSGELLRKWTAATCDGATQGDVQDV